MIKHAAVSTVVERLRDDVIGGAAEAAKEVVCAISEMVRDSNADSTAILTKEVDEAVIEILRVLPSLAPPINALHRVLGQMEDTLATDPSVEALKSAVLSACEGFLVWAETALRKVAQYGAEIIQDGDVVFTYSMSSTVWRMLKLARSQGKTLQVVVTESRPSNEGLLTVREMEQAGIPVSVSVDACIGELVPKCDAVFVGLDALSSHGFSLCKAGTYPTALVSHAHGVPFYVAADTLKLDTSTLLGFRFRTERIRRGDVLSGEYSKGVEVVGDLFDVTPPHLVTAIITEVGLLSPTACATLMWEMKLSERLNALLPAWRQGNL
jgi:ribose 1,5-bisphosphate isomerase